MKKIKIRSINEIKECPFYMLTVDNRITCLFKHAMSKSSLVSLSENPVEFTDEEWRQNCGGKYDKCTIIPLYYESAEDNEYTFVDQEIDNYDPFDAKEKPLPDVVIDMQQVADPYIFEADVLVYPTNIDLTIDDINLERKSKGKIQRECDYIPRPIEMGNVYKTSNGGYVKTKSIYHAVVSGLSRLVANEIKAAMLQALHRADEEKYQHIAILPFDCGTLGIDEVAMSQLAATKEFMLYGNIQNLKKITFLLPEQESYDSFVNYYGRVFADV